MSNQQPHYTQGLSENQKEIAFRHVHQTYKPQAAETNFADRIIAASMEKDPGKAEERRKTHAKYIQKQVDEVDKVMKQDNTKKE
ncbi:hypothetical protein B0I35DRAFT_435737 [Stachybotrys elegans]|uniref:Uncharacterized protein n=1 Tax=Stachybotrys elegans TaxID=80388 RepID=A0A8K0SS46_9HYPO|nr:hypothetical protein B0I35DRAFT_435737 [Stachybotrys elegans]